MPFEIFSRKSPRLATPSIAFSKLGTIVFNKAAADILHKEVIESVVLLWDSSNSKIGMKTVSKKDPRAYHLHYNPKGNGASFSAKTFLDYIQVDYSERRAIPVEIDMGQDIFLQAKVPDEFLKRRTQRSLVLEGGQTRSHRS